MGERRRNWRPDQTNRSTLAKPPSCPKWWGHFISYTCDSECPVQKLSLVACGSSAAPSNIRDERFQERPFLGRRKLLRQGCLRQKTALTQKPVALAIRLANGTWALWMLTLDDLRRLKIKR